MRVGIIGLLQESNTFIHERTTLDHFRQDLLLQGDQIRCLADAYHEIGGFFEGLERAGADAVPIFLARALPYGTMTADCYRSLREMMRGELRAARALDGVLVACHGANVAENVRDVDGDWLTLVRSNLPNHCPLIATLDLHGNLSPKMVAATDALLAYRTNPHVDQRACGLKAAALMVDTLRGEVHPTQAAVYPPLVINIQQQDTSNLPCARHFETANSQLHVEGVLANSILLGFPYADVEEVGCSAIAVTDGNLPLARRLALELGRSLWHDRKSFVPQLLNISVALAKARTLTGRTCLLDMGDNVGGGSPGDSTFLVRALHNDAAGPAFACLYDPESVHQAESAGIGNSAELRMGGKSDLRHGKPLMATVTVRGLYEGRFRETQPRHGGFIEFDQGRTAVVETSRQLTLMLNSRRMVPFSLHQLLSCGVDPAHYRLLVVKGVHAPIAAYRDVCDNFLHVNTPGVTTADLTQLAYHQRRRPLFPFEPDCQWGLEAE